MWLTKKQCGKIVSTQEFLVSPLQGKKNELSLQTVCTLYAHSTPSTCNWSLPSALKIPEEQSNIERKENVSEYHKTSKGSVRFWISNVSYRLICERLGPRSQCYLGKGTETKSWWVAGWNRLLGGGGACLWGFYSGSGPFLSPLCSWLLWGEQLQPHAPMLWSSGSEEWVQPTKV